MQYPSPFPAEQLEVLITAVKDWQVTHGSLLKLIPSDNEHTVLSRPVGVALFPTLFPVSRFEEALALQKTYNKLYAAVAEDEEWLFETLKDLIDVDPLTNRLWRIYQEVKQEGYIQNVSLGIFRSDYMLHHTERGVCLKQVELNTVACAGGTHSNNISSMHLHLQRTGLYQSTFTRSHPSLKISTDMLRPSCTVRAIVSGLASAHHFYINSKADDSTKKCILMIVQPYNFNIADERPIEYALWHRLIPIFRLTFGFEVLSQTSLTSNDELLYQPPFWDEPMEVSVVYFRAGFEPHEYDDLGHMARFQLEKSRAIKCPSLLSHFTTFKKVQQSLTLPGALERFLTPAEAALISETFVPIFPMDQSQLGEYATELALDPNVAKDYILKPSLEGGGHNIYGDEIPKFLKEYPRPLSSLLVLMAKIVPPTLENILISPLGIYEGPVISELGVFGVCLWEREVVGLKGGTGKANIKMIEEQLPSWSFKTKSASVDEMSVVKGFGCFDSPALVDDATFHACVKGARKIVPD